SRTRLEKSTGSPRREPPSWSRRKRGGHGADDISTHDRLARRDGFLRDVLKGVGYRHQSKSLRNNDHKFLVDVLGMTGRVQRTLAEAQRREGVLIESRPSRKVHDCELHAASVSRLGPATSYGAEELFQVLRKAHR